MRTTTLGVANAHFDRVALALLGIVVLASATGSAFLVDSVLIWLPVVPHTLIWMIGTFLVLRTEHRFFGWLLAGSGLFVTSFVFGPLYAETGGTLAGVGVALAGLWLWPLMHAIIVYPTGRPASLVLRALAIAVAVGTVVASGHWLAVNMGWFSSPADPLELAIALSSIPLFLSFPEQLRIYRRRPLVEQKQLKWYVFGLAAIPLYMLPGLLGWSEEAFGAVDAATTILFPLAILVGITRYRLYEVDRIVSRTVAYALVLAVLAAVFVGGVTGLTSLLPAQDGIAVVVTTVVVMALFSPVLRRVRDAVDRRFDRSRYESGQVVEEFGRTIAEVADLREVHLRLHDVLGRTVAPATVAVWEPVGGDGSTAAG
jgi:MFS family permease